MKCFMSRKEWRFLPASIVEDLETVSIFSDGEIVRDKAVEITMSESENKIEYSTAKSQGEIMVSDRIRIKETVTFKVNPFYFMEAVKNAKTMRIQSDPERKMILMESEEKNFMTVLALRNKD